MSAILFDMDGTLIDSEPLWFAAEVQVMQELGAVWEPSDQINCLGGPMERTERYMQERTGNIKPFGYFSERLDLVMEQKLVNELTFMPNALELTSECISVGIQLALVTASTGRQMRSVLTRFPSNTFEATISRDDVTNSKPFPDPYLLAAKTMGVDITKCLVFEDSLTGVESGLRAGAQVIGIPHLVEMKPHSNLRLIDSLAEISLEQILNWYPFLSSRVRSK
jgi:HAD superfamily hydrolase (TIGR01509 family)